MGSGHHSGSGTPTRVLGLLVAVAIMFVTSTIHDQTPRTSGHHPAMMAATAVAGPTVATHRPQPDLTVPPRLVPPARPDIAAGALAVRGCRWLPQRPLRRPADRAPPVASHT